MTRPNPHININRIRPTKLGRKIFCIHVAKKLSCMSDMKDVNIVQEFIQEFTNYSFSWKIWKMIFNWKWCFLKEMKAILR